jgi:hypothetical protein
MKALVTDVLDLRAFDEAVMDARLKTPASLTTRLPSISVMGTRFSREFRISGMASNGLKNGGKSNANP